MTQKIGKAHRRLLERLGLRVPKRIAGGGFIKSGAFQGSKTAARARRRLVQIARKKVQKEG